MIGVETFQAFRPREGEPGTIQATDSLRSLLSFEEPTDIVGRAIRTAQLDALVRMVPVTVASQLFAAGLIAWSLRGMIPDIWLGLWFGVAFILCSARTYRALRLRRDADYARRKPPNLKTITLIVTLLGLMWLVPSVFWFEHADTEHRMMLGVLCVALMSAAGVSLATVPQACLVYLGLLTIGGLKMTSQFHNPIHMGLMLIFAGAVGSAAIASARRFVGHVRTQIELQEQSALIGLLREFEASGSDWLWQLDKDLKLTYMSRAMAEAIGKPLSQLIGVHARYILDPDGNAVQLSTGMRRLMLHATERTAFRDTAIPIDHGRRWWSISAKPLIDAEGRFHGWRGVGSDQQALRGVERPRVVAGQIEQVRRIAHHERAETLLRHGFPGAPQPFGVLRVHCVPVRHAQRSTSC